MTFNLKQKIQIDHKSYLMYRLLLTKMIEINRQSRVYLVTNWFYVTVLKYSLYLSLIVIRNTNTFGQSLSATLFHSLKANKNRFTLKKDARIKSTTSKGATILSWLLDSLLFPLFIPSMSRSRSLQGHHRRRLEGCQGR